MWKKIEFNVNAKPDQVLRKYLTQKLLKKSEDENENMLRLGNNPIKINDKNIIKIISNNKDL